MTRNMGPADRLLRLVLGIFLLAAPFSGLALFGSGVFTTISIIAGLVMVGTAAVRFCPLYAVLGIRTCKL